MQVLSPIIFVEYKPPSLRTEDNLNNTFYKVVLIPIANSIAQESSANLQKNVIGGAAFHGIFCIIVVILRVCDALIQACSIQSCNSPHTLRMAYPMLSVRCGLDLHDCLKQIGGYNLCIYNAAYLPCGHSLPHSRRIRTRTFLLIGVILNGTKSLNASLLQDFYPAFLRLGSSCRVSWANLCSRQKKKQLRFDS